MNNTLETPRLLLRRWTPDDVAEMCEIYVDTETMQFFGNGKPFSPGEVAESLVSVITEYADRGFGNYAVIEKRPNKIIGHCGLHRGHESDIAVELDCLIARERWGLGHGTEAAVAVVREGLLHGRIALVSGIAHCENRASIALMQKVGTTYARACIRFGFDSVLYEVSSAKFFEAISS